MVSYACYLLLLIFMPYLPALAIGWAVGVTVSFFLNCRFTYHVPPTWRGFLYFPLSSIPNFLLSSAGVVLMVEVLDWNEQIAPLIATVLAIPFSYFIARWILT